MAIISVGALNRPHIVAIEATSRRDAAHLIDQAGFFILGAVITKIKVAAEAAEDGLSCLNTLSTDVA